MGGLDWKTIELGKQYQWEETYYMIANVTVIEKHESDTHEGFKLRVDEWLGGIGLRFKEGDVFNVSRLKDDRSFDYLLKMKFEEVGTMPDYMIL